MFTAGVVPYLNALPLYRTLELSGQVRILRLVPAELRAALESGACDVATLPVVDYLRGIGALISDVCIASDGPVRSVMLISQVPVQEIRTIAADTSSHTSVSLLRVILHDGYRLPLPMVPHPPAWREMLATHDAALLIGDHALQAGASAREEGYVVLDLGAAWTHGLTKLPFVYAAWIGRSGLGEAERAELTTLLQQARDEGVQDIPRVVNNSTELVSVSAAVARDYLENNIQFTFTPRHRQGMEEFGRRCRTLGLLDPATGHDRALSGS